MLQPVVGASVRIMFRAILLQLAVVLVAVAILTGIFGIRGAVSGFIGGMAYFVPNLLFAIRLGMLSATGRTGPMSFMAGELLKLVATVVLLVLAQRWFDVHWPAMLLGLFAALQANLFAFLLKN